MEVSSLTCCRKDFQADFLPMLVDDAPSPRTATLQVPEPRLLRSWAKRPWRYWSGRSSDRRLPSMQYVLWLKPWRIFGHVYDSRPVFCVGRSHHGDSGVRSNADHGRGRSHGSNRHCHYHCHRRFRHHNLDEPAAHAIESTATPFTATSRRPLGLSASSSTSIFS